MATKQRWDSMTAIRCLALCKAIRCSQRSYHFHSSCFRVTLIRVIPGPLYVGKPIIDRSVEHQKSNEWDRLCRRDIPEQEYRRQVFQCTSLSERSCRLGSVLSNAIHIDTRDFHEEGSQVKLMHPSRMICSVVVLGHVICHICCIIGIPYPNVDDSFP